VVARVLGFSPATLEATRLMRLDHD
jgi:hypothetical protein